jgi:hypothetical protein
MTESCRYFLAERDGPMAVRLVDGCHDSPEGVMQALKLHRRIFGREADWCMVEIHTLPDLDPPINEAAADDCAHLVRWASGQAATP